MASTKTRCPSTYRGSEVRSRGFLRLRSGTTGIVKTLAMTLRVCCGYSRFCLDGVFEYNAASFTMQPESSGVSLSFSVGYNLGLAGGLQLEHFGGNFLSQLNVGIFGEPIVSVSLHQLLLHRYSGLWIDPQNDLWKMFFDFVRFRDQLQPHRVSAIDLLFTAISDVKVFAHFITTAAKTEHEKSFSLLAVGAGVVHVYGTRSGLIQLNLALRENYLLSIGRVDISRHLGFASVALEIYFPGLSPGFFVDHTIEGRPGKIRFGGTKLSRGLVHPGHDLFQTCIGRGERWQNQDRRKQQPRRDSRA